MWVLLDRDGTINHDFGYVGSPDDVRLLVGVIDGLKRLQELGYDLAVLSNQSGIGRGYFSEDDVDSVNLKIEELLDLEGITVKGFFYCPHTPDDKCVCRKPLTGMLDQLSDSFNFSSRNGWMIGDKQSDIEFGISANLTTILIADGNELAGDFGQQFSVADLSEAARIIAGDAVDS